VSDGAEPPLVSASGAPVLISLWLPVMLPSYVTHRGWLTVVAVLALALLLGMAWISHQFAADES
jgi:hypothetical protein